MASPMAQRVKNPVAMQETLDIQVWSLGLQKPLEDPLEYSYLENPMDRGTWQATVYRVAESDVTEVT